MQKVWNSFRIDLGTIINIPVTNDLQPSEEQRVRYLISKNKLMAYFGIPDQIFIYNE